MSTSATRGNEAGQARFQPRTITVDPLTPTIGAEIGGVDLSRNISDEQFAEIRAAFNIHHVLVFRDQVLTIEDHKRFARMFGRLHVHPFHAKGSLPEHAKEGGDAPDPEIHLVKADANSRHVAGELWHTDVSCDAEPPLGSMLYITETPEIGGGDTCFLSTIRAYDALSPRMKEILLGLSATHDGAKLYSGGYGLAQPDGNWPQATHPVIIRHPENGRRGIFVNRGFTVRINELARAESDALLAFLFAHIENTLEFQCRVRWRPNTLTFWDNRVTQHHAVWDYFPHSRYGRRVSIVGSRPSRD